jgi:hypothetical protein
MKQSRYERLCVPHGIATSPALLLAMTRLARFVIARNDVTKQSRYERHYVPHGIATSPADCSR